MSDVLIPVLEDFKRRLERIETMLQDIKGGKEGKEMSEEKKNLAMDEIQDYLQKINMA